MALLLLLSLQGTALAQSPSMIQGPVSGAAARYFLPPEYAPVQAVLVSEIILEDENGYRLLQALLNTGISVWLLAGAEREPEIRAHLRQVYGLDQAGLSRLKLLALNTDTVWARDWAPLMTLPRSGQKSLRLLDPMYSDQRRQDDALAAGLLSGIDKGRLLAGWSVGLDPVPLWLEGGNLICSQSHCLLSEKALARNPAESAQTLKARLQNLLDQQIGFVPVMPHETTGHLDLWAKLLNEQTLLIARIDAQSLKLAPAALQPVYADMQRFLEQQAELLARQWPELKILRVPMPVPEHTPERASGGISFRSYVNSLLVNGTVILPRYVRSAYGGLYRDQSLLKSYEAEVENVYQQAGFRPVWVEADYLIPGGGAWHCATMQIPALNPN